MGGEFGRTATMSKPICLKRRACSGAVKVSLSLALSSETTAAGVPLGTSTPCQVTNSYPGNPAWRWSAPRAALASAWR